MDLTRSQVFLELARTVFQEQDHLEPTMVTILSNFLQLIGKPSQTCNAVNMKSIMFVSHFYGVSKYFISYVERSTEIKFFMLSYRILKTFTIKISIIVAGYVSNTTRKRLSSRNLLIVVVLYIYFLNIVFTDLEAKVFGC